MFTFYFPLEFFPTVNLICSALVLIIHCLNYFPCTSFPLWEITSQSDSIEKSNIINEAWGLFSGNLLSPSLCWLSVVSYTAICFNGLHAWKCKTSRNGECGEEGALRFTHLSWPLSIFLSFLNYVPRSFLCAFLILCWLPLPPFYFLSVWLIISLFLQTLSQCNKATWHLVQQIP